MGELYSKLFLRYDSGLFTFRDAEEYLQIDKNKLLVAFSRLHKARILLIFDRKRPRLYRLIDPRGFIILASGLIKNVDKIKQERYIKLLCDALYALNRSLNLTSVALYGSVARGDAKENSDIDILVISNDFHGSIGKRIEVLFGIEKEVRDELKWLRDRKIHTNFSFYPLREEEALRKPLLFLDMIEDAIILYDKDRFLEAVLAELRTEVLRLGARRVYMERDKWYWDLKPYHKLREELVV